MLSEIRPCCRGRNLVQPPSAYDAILVDCSSTSPSRQLQNLCVPVISRFLKELFTWDDDTTTCKRFFALTRTSTFASLRRVFPTLTAHRTFSRRRGPKPLLDWYWAAAVLAILPGCTARTSTFEIVDHRDPGSVKRYRETFDESYYDLDGSGNLDLILRRCRTAEGAGESEVTQVIHIRSVWRSIPGATVADKDQINATVCYSIVGRGMGATYEGAGSVFYSSDRGNKTLSGTLDRAILRPVRDLNMGEPLFEQTELSGRFIATRNPRRVVRIVNETERLFGRRPAHRDTSSPER